MMVEISETGGGTTPQAEGNRGKPVFALSQTQVEAVGRELAEPGWFTDLRQAAYHQYHQSEGIRQADRQRLRGFPAMNQIPSMELAALAFPGKWPHPPAAMVHGLREKESAGQIIVEGNETKIRQLDPEWLDTGVVFSPMDLAVRQTPEILQNWMGRILKPDHSQTIALGSAAYNLGVVLFIPKGVQVTKPFHSLFWTPAAGFQAWRMLVVVEEGAKASILQETASIGTQKDGFQIGLVEIHLGAGAELDISSMLNGGDQTIQLIHQAAELEAGSSLRWASGVLGGSSTGMTTELILAGEGAHGMWTGFSHLTGNQHAEWATMQHHRAPHTVSDLLLKVAHAGRSRSTWSGMVRMEAEALGSDGYQADRNLMLSAEAHVESHPGLEILTDDVRCSHGVTAGNLDADELFYLLSRGFLQEDARSLLTAGFFETAWGRLSEENIRNYLRTNFDTHVRNAPAEQRQPRVDHIRRPGDDR